MTQKTFRDTVVRILEEYLQDNIRCSMPAKVVSVKDYERYQCIDVKPLVNNLYKDNMSVQYPVIFSVPVVLLGGGNALVSVPIAVGDTVKLEFSRDSLQEFLDSEGKNPVTPSTFRRYALTDAIATPALPTRSKTLNPNPTDLEIKLLDSSGEVNGSIRITPDGDLIVDVKNNTNVTVGGDANLTIDGAANVVINGDCNLTASTVNVDASQTNLGTGGQQIARLGDQVTVQVIGVQPGGATIEATGTITEGGTNTSI